MTDSKKKKGNVAKAIGEQRADALENWLSSNPKIPRYQGRANQAAIGRKFGITKSTWGSNPRLKTLWQQIQTKAAQQTRNTESPNNATQRQPEEVRKLLKDKDKLIGWLRRELARAESKVELLQKDGAAEELLILTGRYIPYALLKDESESDTEPMPNKG
ncbi:MULTISPECIES: hypothetical protein [Vibrio]|jgi:hypothetical protein|uniref:hypothetical protein n=1 Tax=Vibrio TaxID=662 RepID=UPI0002FA42F1|nr:hypothetical protein [Vibrio crassostreae]OEE89403.1 hypothetical protein A140_18675 [Vibrio crassostreae 9ZC88]